MKKKAGVNIQGIRPELLFGMNIADYVFDINNEQLVITSAIDGKHSATSLHYTGCAFDCRIRNIHKSKIPTIINELKESLADDFDVVLESTHIHIEYQPKYKAQ